jgi:hypothetical protein
LPAHEERAEKGEIMEQIKMTYSQLYRIGAYPHSAHYGPLFLRIWQEKKEKGETEDPYYYADQYVCHVGAIAIYTVDGVIYGVRWYGEEACDYGVFAVRLGEVVREDGSAEE